MPSETTLVSLIIQLGVPAAMLIVFIVGFQRKWYHTAATVEAKDERIADLKEQLRVEREQKEAAQDLSKITATSLNEVLKLTQGLVLQAVKEVPHRDAHE